MIKSSGHSNPVLLDLRLSTHSVPGQFSSLDDSKSFISTWQKMNTEVTIGSIFSKLNELNYISNLKAVTDSSLTRKGMWFSDSDVFKSLEAALWASKRNPELLNQIKYDEIVEIIEQAQDSDGYINSWFQISAKDLKWKDFASGHEMYTAGHLIQAGIAEARVLGRGKLYAVSVRFADLLVNKFGGDAPYASDGHPEIETALIELYRESENVAYLDLSRKMLEGRGEGRISKENTGSFHPSPPIYIQDHKKIRDSHEAVGHCVRQMYLNLGVMDLFFETNDKALLSAQEKMWENTTNTKMYLTGGIGSRHRDESFGDSYELPNDRAYAETCASIGYFMWNWKLLLATGNAKYADLMETILYNIIAGSISDDYKRFFYSNPLHRRADHLASFDEESSERMDWYRVSCCPPNIGRLIGSIDSYTTSENEKTVYIHHYMPGTFGSDRFSKWNYEVVTNYPYSSDVEIQVKEGSSHHLLLRKPSWCSKYKVTVNGKNLENLPLKDGYLVIGQVSTGDLIKIEFQSEYEYVYPHELLDASRGTVAVKKGAVIYALDQTANPEIKDVERCFLITDGKFNEVEATDSNGVRYSTIKVNGEAKELHRGDLSFGATLNHSKKQECQLTLIPYAKWGNPVKGGMRVWIPRAD